MSERYDFANKIKFSSSIPKRWSALLASPSTHLARSRSLNEAQTTSIAYRNERDSVILPKSDDKSIVVAASTPSLCMTDSRSLNLPRARTSSNHGSSIKSLTVIPFFSRTTFRKSLP